MEVRETSRSALLILFMFSAYLFTSWVHTNLLAEHVQNGTASYGEKDATINTTEYAAFTKAVSMTNKTLIGGNLRNGKLNQSTTKNSREAIQSCLQRFICEIHSKPPGYIALNKLEESILSSFNSGYMEGPTSPIYPYQLAAHFGQLSSGCQPSACQSLYSTCPYSNIQFIRIITRLKPLKGRFL